MTNPYAQFSPKTDNPYAKYALPAKPGAGAEYDPSSEGTADYVPRQFTAGEKTARAVGATAQGANDALYGTVLAPLDASGWVAKKLGLVSPDAEPPSRTVTNFLASIPGKIGFASKDAAPRIEPAGATEKTLYGLGEGVGNALSIAVPAGAVANAARAGTVTSGVARTLATQPVMQTIAGGVGGAVGAATDNPWLGLAASAAVPVAASVGRAALMSPFQNQLAPQEQRLVQAANAEGIPLTPAQRTGSRSLRALEDVMVKTPGSSGRMGEVVANQRQQFNRAALERAGVQATDASPDTIDAAFHTLGNQFDSLARQTTLNVDRQFGQDIANAANQYGRRLPSDVAPVFQSYMDDLMPDIQAANTGGNPQIAGDVYATIRSDIGRRIRANANRPDLQEALGAVQTALDDAVTRSTSGPLQQAWQEVRRQYQALMTIDKAMGGGTQADRAAGNIPLGALKGAVKQADPRGYARGRGQMNELSRVGDFIGQRVPDSGTPVRQMLLNPLEWPMVGVMNVLSRAYNSPTGQAYLTNNLTGRTDFPAWAAGELARQGSEEIRGGRNALSQRGGR